MAVGALLIATSRSGYRSPDEYIARRISFLPQKPWTWALTRGWCIFSIWLGIVMISASFTILVPGFRSTTLDRVIMVIAAIATPFALPSRRQPSREHQRDPRSRWQKNRDDRARLRRRGNETASQRKGKGVKQ